METTVAMDDEDSTRSSETRAARCRTFRTDQLLVLVSVILMSFGMVESYTAAMVCDFVLADSQKVDPFLIDLYYSGLPHDNNTQRDVTGLGFFFFEGPDGKCSCSMLYSNVTGPEDGIWLGKYVRYLGDDWQQARSILCAGIFFAGLLWVWLLAYPFFTYSRRAQFCWVAILIGLVVPLHLRALNVMDSEFCEEADCELGNAGHSTWIAAVCYFCTGALLLVHAICYISGPTKGASKTPVVERRVGGVITDESDRPHLWSSDGLADVQEVPVSPALLQAMMEAQERHQESEE